MLATLAYAVGVAGCSHNPVATGPAPDDVPINPPASTTPAGTFAYLSSDIVHPSFAPREDRIAFAEVMVADGSETTRILVADLRSGAIDTVLTTAAANQFATYGVSALSIEWASPDTLLVSLHDGDVDVARLQISVPDRAIVGQSLDDTAASSNELPEQALQVLQRLQNLYPDTHSGVLRQMAETGSVTRGGSALVYQKNYAGEDQDIWYSSLDRVESRVLVALSDRSLYAFGGALDVGTSTYFLVTENGSSTLFRFGLSAEPDAAVVVPTGIQTPSVRVVWSTPDIALIQIVGYSPYEEGHNPAFWIGETRVTELASVGQLYEIALSTTGRYIAQVYWEGGHRRLLVEPSGMSPSN